MRLSTEELEAFQKEEAATQFKKTIDMAMSVAQYIYIEHRNMRSTALITTEASIMAAANLAATFVSSCCPKHQEEAVVKLKLMFEAYFDSFLEKGGPGS